MANLAMRIVATLSPLLSRPAQLAPREALATVEFPPFGSSKKPGLTRFGGAGRNLRTKAAYSQIRPLSETRNRLVQCAIGSARRESRRSYRLPCKK
jgi:hypothetical protein